MLTDRSEAARTFKVAIGVGSRERSSRVLEFVGLAPRKFFSY